MAGVDPIALWSMIGTWAAVLLASVALLGIIGPVFLLRAVRSERNEALNSLRDVDQDFVTRGIGVGRSFRLLHRVKVPSLLVVPGGGGGSTPKSNWSWKWNWNWNLSRSRTTTGAAAAENGCISRAGQPWTLQQVKGTKCRAGWARLCRLLEAYGVGNDQRGSLVLKDGHSWLPVSRFWILTLGLLGRYGRRDGKGFTFNVNALRRDLKESRMLHIEYDDGDRDMTDSNPNSEAERPKPNENSGLDLMSDEVLIPKSDHSRRLGVRQMQTPTPTLLQKHIIYGMTGIIELGDDAQGGERHAVKRQHRSVIFTLFNDQEMGLQTDNTNTTIPRALMGETLSLQQLYWLAAGFMPTTTTVYGNPQAISLQDPLIPNFTIVSYESSDDEADPPAQSQNVAEAAEQSREPGDFEPRRYTNPRWQAFQLTPASDRPNTLLKAMHAYNMVNTTLLSFQEVPRHITKAPIELQHLRSCAAKCTGTSRWISMGFTKRGQRGNQLLYKRADVHRLVYDFLRLEVHTWNYLTWKLDGKVWKRMLMRAMRFQRGNMQSSLTKASTISMVEKICTGRVASVGSDDERKVWKKLRRAVRTLERWDDIDGFHQLKTADYIAVSQCLLSCIALPQDVRYAVSVLWITNFAFQERVKTLLEQWSVKESGDTFAVEVNLEHNVLMWLLKGEQRPTNGKNNKKHETMWDESAMESSGDDDGGRIPFAYSSEDPSTRIVQAAEQYEVEIPRAPSSETKTGTSTDPSRTIQTSQVTCDELFLIVVWATTRCALWEEAPDSKPLLDFVRKLGDVVQFA